MAGLIKKILGKKDTEKPKKLAKPAIKKVEVPTEADLASQKLSSSALIKRNNPCNVTKKIEIAPVRVDKFDLLLADHGLEKGSTTLISGGAGTGKTTFCMQSLYNAAKSGEKCIYISFEEEPAKIMQHMKKNFGWDFCKFEKAGTVAIIKIDPSKIARMVEGILAKEVGALRIKLPKLELPFDPDRMCIDSLSALSIAFEHEESYRKYIRELFEMLEGYNSINIVIGETEQNPTVYSRSGVEEFLADGVIVLYNLRIRGKRKNALEILKMRSGSHVKDIVPYKLGPKGIEIRIDEELEI